MFKVRVGDYVKIVTKLVENNISIVPSYGSAEVTIPSLTLKLLEVKEISGRTVVHDGEIVPYNHINCVYRDQDPPVIREDGTSVTDVIKNPFYSVTGLIGEMPIYQNLVNKMYEACLGRDAKATPLGRSFSRHAEECARVVVSGLIDETLGIDGEKVIIKEE
ncbi:MAG: hypothetical protein GY861_23740 [bacterium]|nr:hypothetical protein [bacterium]